MKPPNMIFALCVSADHQRQLNFKAWIQLIITEIVIFIANILWSNLTVVGYTISQWFVRLISNNIRTQYTSRICNEIIDCCLFRDYIKTSLNKTVQYFPNCIRLLFFLLPSDWSEAYKTIYVKFIVRNYFSTREHNIT